VDALWGIGAKTTKKLAGLGIMTVSDLAAADPDALAAEFGPMTGPWLVLLACGRGDSEVDSSPYVAKAHGREETFQRNIPDWPQVEAEVARIAGLLAADLVSEPRPAVRVVVKVRYAPFVTETHGVTLEVPSSDAGVLAAAAAEALGRFTGRRPVRLLGVRAQFEPGARLRRPCLRYRSRPSRVDCTFRGLSHDAKHFAPIPGIRSFAIMKYLVRHCARKSHPPRRDHCYRILGMADYRGPKLPLGGVQRPTMTRRRLG